MAREIIEGRALAEFPLVQGSDFLAETHTRVLSHDDRDGAFTAYVVVDREIAFYFPPGRTLEFFVLTGSATVNGRPVPQGWFAYLPPQTTERAVTIRGGATIFLATGEKGVGSGEFEIVDPETKPWQVRTSDCAHSSTGTSTNVVKYLRVDPENRDNFGIDVMWPGGGLDCTEWHDVADEVFRLRGDLLLLDPVSGKPVEAGPGSYAWRPLDSRHLPKYSHTGCVQLFRNREWPSGKATVTYVEAPGWDSALTAYKARFDVIGPIPGL